jgi:hypothetical protein
MNQTSPLRKLLRAAGFLSLTGFCLAQTSGLAPLGLPRLKDQVQTGEAAPLARSKFATDALAAQDAAGTLAGEKDGARFLALDAATAWSTPLRGDARSILFVSFSLYGSTGTILEIAGARLGVVESEMDNYAQLAVDEVSPAGPKWRKLPLHVPFEKHQGKLLAPFIVLTVRLGPAKGVWDLYDGAQLLAEDLPLDPAAKLAQFILRAGGAGAMLNGLVQADENPLYEDANANGIDDRFEQTKNGKLLASDASPADRKELIKQWRAAQRTERPPALFFNRPLPDGK